MTTMAKIDSEPVSLPAAADLSTKLFRFGKFTATGIDVCSVAGEKADGVIGAMYKKTPAAGDAVDFYVERIPIVEAGVAIAVNDQIATDANGKAKVAGAGDTVLGIALDASTADKQFIRFRTPYTRSPSAANVADAQTTPGTMVVFTKAIADAASADYDVVMAEKIEVLDVTVQKRNGAGGAGGTVTVKNGANAITDAIDINDADKLLSRAASIDDAFSTINAAGTLRFSVVDGGDSSILVTVIGVKRA
jgi:hypothetical protein